MCFSYLLVHLNLPGIPLAYIVYLSASGTPNYKITFTISKMGDKSLNLLVRQREPTYLEIVFCKHLEAMEEPAETLLRLVLTGADITGLCILPTAITHVWI